MLRPPKVDALPASSAQGTPELILLLLASTDTTPPGCLNLCSTGWAALRYGAVLRATTARRATLLLWPVARGAFATRQASPVPGHVQRVSTALHHSWFWNASVGAFVPKAAWCRPAAAKASIALPLASRSNALKTTGALKRLSSLDPAAGGTAAAQEPARWIGTLWAFRSPVPSLSSLS